MTDTQAIDCHIDTRGQRLPLGDALINGLKSLNVGMSRTARVLCASLNHTQTGAILMRSAWKGCDDVTW